MGNLSTEMELHHSNKIKILNWKNVISGMKYHLILYHSLTSLDGVHSLQDTAEEKFSELVAIATETIQNRTHRKRKTGKKEQNFSQLWDKIK